MLALCLLLTLVPAAYADNDFTIDTYLEYKTLFDVDVDMDSGVAFIETTRSVADLSFQHKFESDYDYSCIRNDILVLDYFSSSQYPVVRTWITYNAQDAQYFHSVSFELEGTTYTFTDVGNKDRVTKTEHGYRERLLIKYGSNNKDFFSAVTARALVYLYDEDENKTAPKMKMTLHGLETVEADVPEAFWDDFALLVLPFVSNDYAWMKYVKDNDGTPCKVKN